MCTQSNPGIESPNICARSTKFSDRTTVAPMMLSVRNNGPILNSAKMSLRPEKMTKAIMGTGRLKVIFGIYGITDVHLLRAEGVAMGEEQKAAALASASEAIPAVIADDDEAELVA